MFLIFVFLLLRTQNLAYIATSPFHFFPKNWFLCDESFAISTLFF